MPSRFFGLQLPTALALITAVVAGCASQQTVQDAQARIDAHEQALMENQQQQLDIRDQLLRLDIAGQNHSREAASLRQQLKRLETKHTAQLQQLRQMESSVDANSADIKTMKAREAERKKAIERLNQSYEHIEERTSEKMERIGEIPEPQEGLAQ